ncbi:hypothetical protein EYF80_053263 [Liparis tanakae]|uniref:Uncharacterized protein n=1 Tax=Liparis tanakae TaxID=230148 RepID=A0A4Z2F8E5_9TELE|nr:hypothetical protein EYF80_053263 [Liparis tanakae]
MAQKSNKRARSRHADPSRDGEESGRRDKGGGSRPASRGERRRGDEEQTEEPTYIPEEGVGARTCDLR